MKLEQGFVFCSFPLQLFAPELSFWCSLVKCNMLICFHMKLIGGWVIAYVNNVLWISIINYQLVKFNTYWCDIFVLNNKNLLNSWTKIFFLSTTTANAVILALFQWLEMSPKPHQASQELFQLRQKTKRKLRTHRWKVTWDQLEFWWKMFRIFFYS